ncbi:MAG: flippase [Candidatus Omnitrophica bacterium]|nr:flippase [Candidatus Omnitrophota bacterium]
MDKINHQESSEKYIKKLAKGGTTIFIGKLANTFLHFVQHAFLARTLGVPAYGLYAMGSTVISFLHTIALLGLSQGIVKFISSHRGVDDKGREKGILIISIVLSSVCSVAISSILYIYSPFIAINIFHESALIGVMRIFSISLPFFVFFTIAANNIRAVLSMKRYIYILLIRTVINLILLTTVFLIGYRLYGAIWSFVISCFAASIISLYYLKKDFPHFLSKTKAVYEPLGLIKFSLPMFFATVSFFLLAKTDIFMLGFFLNMDDVGIYSMATIIAASITLLITPLNETFAPIIADLFNRNKLKNTELLFKTTTRWNLIISILCFLPIVFFSKNLLGLFGKSFETGSSVLVVLSFFYLLKASLGPVPFMLQMSGHPNLILINNAIMAVLNIILNALLIPIFGILGAAFATGISLSLCALLGLIEVYSLLKIHPWNMDYSRLIIPLCAALVTFALIRNITACWFLKLAYVNFVFIAGFLLLLPQEDRFLLYKAVNAVRRVLKSGDFSKREI